ncbi:MarR family winged helix-turn-helix transcriptional regulator [Streptomyces mesophilus]|uniref:MarR family winged helix-turn-helix transcriptional regulator n=1 Tax=Streptomyces mesophilus TaxID=1775132 RepID=UPI00332E0E86
MAISDREVTAVDVGLRYLSLGHRLRKAVDDSMAAGGLSLARTKVLQVVERRGAIKQTALARELGQAARSVTQSVEALEREGLIERAADPGDARSKLVRLTPAGVKALAAGTAAGEQALREAFGAMGREQLADLSRLLDSLQAGLPGAASER